MAGRAIGLLNIAVDAQAQRGGGIELIVAPGAIQIVGRDSHGSMGVEIVSHDLAPVTLGLCRYHRHARAGRIGSLEPCEIQGR